MRPRSADAASAGAAFSVAREDDVEALVAIDADSPRPWRADAFGDELKREPATLFVLRSSTRPIAFVVTRVHNPEMDILNLAVAREHRRRGFGGLLLRSLLTQAASSGIQTAFLEVREGNLEARALYESAGFRESQRRPGFYRDPVEDAILLRAEIGSARG